MNLEEALELISDCLGYDIMKGLAKGLPDGKIASLRFDEELCIEIATACLNWRNRLCPIEDPWKVSQLQNDTWVDVTDKPMHHADAYKIWYRLTNGAKENKDTIRLVKYWHDFANEETEESEEDDFSIRYLLNKSFGD